MIERFLHKLILRKKKNNNMKTNAPRLAHNSNKKKCVCSWSAKMAILNLNVTINSIYIHRINMLNRISRAKRCCRNRIQFLFCYNLCLFFYFTLCFCV